MPSTCDSIKVAIRIRPFIPYEEKKNLRAQWSVQNNNIYRIDESGQRNGELYSFDHIFQMSQTNKQIYDEIVKDFVESALNGVNSTIFAYGQTSSGKTYTMLGGENDKGIVPLAIDNIFDSLHKCENRKFLVRVSYVEIYNEKINDLLDPKNKDIKIQEHFSGAIGLRNVKEEIVSTPEQVYEYLKHGNENRHIAETRVNDHSSRSHTIFRIVIESVEICNFESDDLPVQISNLNLVDLAGSERVAQTKATGVLLKEGGHINKSLSALGLVIRQLSDGQEFVNFRDSKLTRLLQHSLGGNAKTLIIATITLASMEYTSSTLSFAQRAKAVKNRPQINEVLTDSATSKRYAHLNVQLKKRLEEQVLINKKLERTKEENSREILRLQEQMQMLEIFQHGVKTNNTSAVKPKRRHTIANLGQKAFLNSIMEEPEEGVQIIEGEVENSSLKVPSEDLVTPMATPIAFKKPELLNSNFSTPKRDLRIRIHALEKDYDELVTYTKDENCVLSETSKKLEEIEKQLANEKRKLIEYQKVRKVEEEFLVEHLNSKFNIREKELLNRIANLEEELKIQTSANLESRESNCGKMEHDFIINRPSNNTFLNDYPLELNNEDIKYLRNQLMLLEDTLKHCSFIATFDSTLKKTKLDSNQEIIESFNAKIKTSKEIIESEIWKQINSFNQIVEVLHEPVVLPNEIEAFDKLLKELSAFENDMALELINNTDNSEGERMEHLKILFKIYESLIEKNKLIGWCSKKILSLQEELKINEDVQKKEQNDLKSTIDKLNLDIVTKDENLCKLRNTLNLVEDEVRELRESCHTLTNEIHNLESNKCQYKDIITKYETENNTLKLDIKRIKEEEMKSEIDKLHTLEDSFNVKIQQLEENNDILNNKIDCLESQLKVSECKLSECLRSKNDLEVELKKANKLNKLSAAYFMKIKTLEDCATPNELESPNRTLTHHNTSNDDLEMETSKICRIVSSNTKLIEQLLKRVHDYDSKSVHYEERLRLLHETEKKRIDEINCLNEEIATLKSYKKINENLTFECDKYKCDFAECNEKLKTFKYQNLHLEYEVKDLQDKLNDYKNNYLTLQNTVKDKDISLNELTGLKKMFECILYNIIEHLIKEERALLAVRHTQEQRDYFKSIRNDLKDNNANLKSELLLFQSQESYNLNEVNDILLKSISILKEYSNLEKSFLKSQIELLDTNSKAYLEEISVLKKAQEEFIDRCINCDSLKSELSHLNKKLTSKETMLTDTLSKLRDLQEKSLTKNSQTNPCSKCDEYKNTNVNLQKVLNDLLKKNMQLKDQMDEEKDMKIEVRQTEIMNTYKRHIDRLRRKVEVYENASKNRKCVEIQCNLFEADQSVLLQKCQKLEVICQNKSDEVLAIEKTYKEALESSESVLKKYQQLKIICQSRRDALKASETKIEEYKRQFLEMQKQLELQRKKIETYENDADNRKTTQVQVKSCY